MSTTELSDQFKEQFHMKLASLDAMLKAYDPNMGNLLTEIHGQLISIPELTYMLKEEEIGQIVEASKRVMKVEIMANTPKKSLKKEMEGLNADDF